MTFERSMRHLEAGDGFAEAIYSVTTQYTNASDVLPPGELSKATR